MSKKKMREATERLRHEAAAIVGYMDDFADNDDVTHLPLTWSLESAMQDYNSARRAYYNQLDERRARRAS